MSNGRGPSRDRDHKSVERLKGFRCNRKMMTHPNPKQCSKCERWFPPISLCFDKDASSSTGLQSWCVQCKDEWEADPQNIFRRMRAWLVKNEPIAWEQWDACPGGAEAEFRRKFGDRGCVCSTCGAGLREWQRTGHNLDRIDNNDGNLHTPQNTVLACNPCNMTRGRKRYRAWQQVAAALVNEYGWGRFTGSEIHHDAERRVADLISAARWHFNQHNAPVSAWSSGHDVGYENGIRHAVNTLHERGQLLTAEEHW